MIRLKRLNGFEFVLNGDLIKMIEATPDTMITLTSGEKLLVKESVDEVIEKATNFWKRVHQEPLGRMKPE
jgi:flagellar protein FlbD